MKSYAFSFLFLLNVAHAADNLQINVKNFNFTYTDPHGSGTAASFSRSPAQLAAVDVSVDKVGPDFKLSVSGAENLEFELKDAPSLLTDAQRMVVKDFNLTLADKVSLSLLQGVFTSQDDNLKLDGLNLNCDRNLAQAEIMDQLIMGCIQKMSFKTSKFSSAAEKGLVALMTTSISAAIDQGRGVAADLGINSVSLTTTNGKYDLAAEVKAQISGKVKSNGNMSYDPAKGLLTLKISEVKFGLFSVTGKVFDELKKKESEKLKVKEPYVYYSIK